MKRFLTSAILLWAGTAVAQDTVPAIELAPGRSTILRTPNPFRTVSASNPEVADPRPIRTMPSSFWGAALVLLT
jgi:hypothetical protein